jgi:hypothetical protein
MSEQRTISALTIVAHDLGVSEARLVSLINQLKGKKDSEACQEERVLRIFLTEEELRQLASGLMAGLIVDANEENRLKEKYGLDRVVIQALKKPDGLTATRKEEHQA